MCFWPRERPPVVRSRAEEPTLRKLTLMKQGLMQDLLTGRVRVPREMLKTE
jgi:hypothetical protein